MNPPAEFCRIIINEPDRLIFVERVVLEFTNDHLPCIASPIDQDTFLALQVSELPVNPPRETDAPEGEDEKHRINQKDRTWIASEAESPVRENIEPKRADEDTGDDVP